MYEICRQLCAFKDLYLEFFLNNLELMVNNGRIFFVPGVYDKSHWFGMVLHFYTLFLLIFNDDLITLRTINLIGGLGVIIGY